MTTKRIIIKTQFSERPFGRYRSEWRYCGEAFREDILLEALRNNNRVEVILDGIKSYGSTFLDEAFGGLVRERYFTYKDLEKKLIIIANDSPSRKQQIWWHIKNNSEILNQEQTVS